MNTLLNIEDLTISIPQLTGVTYPVTGVSFEVRKNETLCIVGESGCGKSLTSLGVLNLLPRSAQRTATALDFDGQSLLSLGERQMGALRGNRIALILQDPMTSLNPCYTIGNQLIEGFLRHRKASHTQAHQRAVSMLEKVGIPNAAARMVQYPHQLSGGLRQRVVIAMALMCDPDLLLADEPTTALDVTIQAQILALLRELQQELGLALVLITHDLGLVAQLADRVVVMYAGEVVEQGTAKEIFNNPSHPYTEALMQCIPQPGKSGRKEKLNTIPGIVPSIGEGFKGCRFAGRCEWEIQGCRDTNPALRARHNAGHLYRCIRPPEERKSEPLPRQRASGQ